MVHDMHPQMPPNNFSNTSSHINFIFGNGNTVLVQHSPTLPERVTELFLFHHVSLTNIIISILFQWITWRISEVE